MAVRLSYRRTLVALVASVLLLIFYAEAILEIIGFKGLQVRTAAQLEQSGSHEHWINTEVKTEVESLIGISDSDPAIQDTELNVRLDRFPSQNLLSKGGEEVKVTFLLPDGAEVAEPAVKRAKKNTIDKFDTSLPRDHPCALFPLPEANRNRSRTKKGYRRKDSNQLTALCAMPSDDSPLPGFSTAACPVCYLPVGKAVALQPEDGESRIGPSPLRHLSYVNEQHPSEAGHAPKFGGHPTWEDRRDSFQIQGSMNVHCGFVWGASPGVNSGYDIEAPDREAMHACNGIVVASAIFGAYDELKQPGNVSEHARQHVCFFMFVDGESMQALVRDQGKQMGGEGGEGGEGRWKVGLWRLVLVSNIPYEDPRRTGKIPKLLLHRLFPHARFSMWMDGKLRLTVDPYQVMERFLWRSGYEWAISVHYARFDAFVEAEANMAGGKYSNASILEQMAEYRADGLTPYTRDKLPVQSDVPEGCLILRRHTPLSNLMSCLWYNEVDRFTSRDQLSFGYVRDKVVAGAPQFALSMFQDCERRNFVSFNYHKPDQAKAEESKKKKKKKKKLEKKSKLTQEKQFNKLEEDRVRLDIDLS